MNSEVTARTLELQSTLEASRKAQERRVVWDRPQVRAVARGRAQGEGDVPRVNAFSVDVTRKCLVAEGWCPAAAKPRVREALLAANRSASAQMGTVFQPLPTREQPPTYYATNKVTEVFQGIVEAYGVARYREVNPAAMTIVTFPFSSP